MTENIIPLLDSEGQSVKKCSKCGIVKNAEEFNKDRSKPMGLMSSCRDCHKGFYSANRTRLIDANKKWISDNKDHVSRQRRQHRVENKEALNIEQRKCYAANREKLLAQKKQYYKANRHKILNYRNQYYIDNKNEIIKNQKLYRALNKDAISEKNRIKRKTDPMFRLNANVMRKMYHILTKGKNSRSSWETLVGYSIESLRKHLEKQFTDGMTWENYGEWHVDHKIPLAVHNFLSAEDLDFKKAWALKNLQPLWAKDNWAKHDKIDKPFQPSFAFGGTI